MVAAIIQEVHQRQQELKVDRLSSIYFGGGTPSLLSERELEKILEAVAKYFHWDSETEITLEANPDDITLDNLKSWLAAGVNRLSVGIQSFDDADLKYMNRAHSAEEAAHCIDKAKDAGYEWLTADLIYASPTTSDETWQSNISKMLTYDLPHISAYCLTVEEGTALHHQVKQKKAQPVDSVKAVRQFDMLMDSLGAARYEHYEISNYAREGAYAQHNTNYWKGKPYLGLGPAAHSYDGKATRRWNIAHNAKYIKSINDREPFAESETLSTLDQYHEYVLTALRTKWGVSKEKLTSTYASIWKETKLEAEKMIGEGLLLVENDSYLLTRKGKHLADNVSMRLFK